MRELSIKVVIAGRTYPLTIKQEDEENVRKAAKRIEERIKEYEENYSVRDKQDLLAMCALQFANQLLDIEGKQFVEDRGELGRLKELDTLIGDYLEKA